MSFKNEGKNSEYRKLYRTTYLLFSTNKLHENLKCWRGATVSQVCSSSTQVLKPSPQCGAIWRQSLWEMIRPSAQSPYEQDQCSYTRDPTEPPHPMAICKPGSGPLPDTESAGAQILDLPTSSTRRNKWFLFKPLRLWYSVTAA